MLENLLLMPITKPFYPKILEDREELYQRQQTSIVPVLKPVGVEPVSPEMPAAENDGLVPFWKNWKRGLKSVFKPS